jgi:ectoine hydroxylase-related dioxygenase (phytanoyl-CoA dioxygenase family)
MDELSSVTQLEAACMEYRCHYTQHGFMVRFKAIPEKLICDANIADMKTRFLSSNNHKVFNEQDVSQISETAAERRQLVTKHYSKVSRRGFSDKQKKLLRTCEGAVVEIVKELLPDVSAFKTIESVLYSRAGSKERQKPHVDLPETLNDCAALALIAFESNTTFIMFRGSHNMDDVVNRGHFPRIYGLGIGDILIFHPNLIHAGDRFSVSNLRLHYYVIDKTKNYTLNLTYSVEIDIGARMDLLTSYQEHRVVALKERREYDANKKKNRGEAGRKNLAEWRAGLNSSEEKQEEPAPKKKRCRK